MAATRYLVSKAAKSPTANAAKAKARSVVSKGEYKLERAGQKLARDVKKTGVYKATKKLQEELPLLLERLKRMLRIVHLPLQKFGIRQILSNQRQSIRSVELGRS